MEKIRSFIQIPRKFSVHNIEHYICVSSVTISVHHIKVHSYFLVNEVLG